MALRRVASSCEPENGECGTIEHLAVDVAGLTEPMTLGQEMTGEVDNFHVDVVGAYELSITDEDDECEDVWSGRRVALSIAAVDPGR